MLLRGRRPSAGSVRSRNYRSTTSRRDPSSWPGSSLERLIESLSSDMFVEQRAIRIGASVGVAFCRDSYVDADRLLQESDAAAYRAKNGRGRVDVFDDHLRA